MLRAEPAARRAARHASRAFHAASAGLAWRLGLFAQQSITKGASSGGVIRDALAQRQPKGAGAISQKR